MRFTEEEQQFIRDNAKGIDTEQLTLILNKKFNTNYSEYKVYRWKKRNHVCSGVNTKFKKGNHPHNYKLIGSEFVSTEGYTFVKVGEPNIWKHKTTVVYEKEYGKVPEGYCVVFADQDKTNFNLDNLLLVRNKDKLYAKNRHLLCNNKELTKTGLLIAQLANTAHEKREK